MPGRGGGELYNQQVIKIYSDGGGATSVGWCYELVCTLHRVA